MELDCLYCMPGYHPGDGLHPVTGRHRAEFHSRGELTKEAGKT